MTTTSLPMAKLTLEEFKAPGSAEKLPAIQHTTAAPSTTSLASTIAQLPMPPGYKELTKSEDDGLRTNLPKVKVESEREINPSVSDSEDEYDAVPRALNISERRKAQNSKFSAWCVVSEKVTASSVNVYHINQVVKACSQDYEGGSASHRRERQRGESFDPEPHGKTRV